MNEKEERDLTQAKMARSYFDALLEQQFSPTEAMRLTVAMITRRVE